MKYAWVSVVLVAACGAATVTTGSGGVRDGGPAVDANLSDMTAATTGELGSAGSDAGPGCAATETCGNGIDDDCNGLVDDGCPCTVGMTEKCWPGKPAQAGVGACSFGMQTCAASGEFPSWGPCMGAGMPSPDTCDGVDRMCDGNPLANCACKLGDTKPCYDGPAGTEGVGSCKGGTFTCVAMNGVAGWTTTCAGEVLPAAMDGCTPPDDANCNGLVGEGCTVCFGASSTPWQFHDTSGPMCVGTTYSTHGDPQEYQYANIPPATDPGWQAYPQANINFQRMSRLCGTSCECSNGVDFDYWQTFFTIPQNYKVSSLTFTVGTVDDGVRITIFNANYPNGVVAPGSYAYLGGGTTTDLSQYIVAGQNRVVLTHLDDCCVNSAIGNASITLNGMGIGPCM